MNALRDDPMPTNVARVLDFPGFYESLLTGGLDNAEEMVAYNLAEDHPDVDETLIAERIYECSDHGKGFDAITRAYVEWLNTITDGTGIVLTLESIVSPREYNFTTDALFVTVNDIELLFNLTNTPMLNTVAAEQFTSRSGFISFYSPDVDTWGPLDEWDHNQRGALLTAFLRQRMEEEGITDDDMLEYLNEPFGNAVDEQIDWGKLESTLGITS